MKVAMVKHTPHGQVYWFEVPDHLAKGVHDGARVLCDTARGCQPGIIVGSILDNKDVKAIAEASGAVYPLRQIIAVSRKYKLADIKIPKYMRRTKPKDEKIAKRFLEIYHTGQFDTYITINEDGTLVDGYSAYLVAQAMGFLYITAIPSRIDFKEDSGND